MDFYLRLKSKLAQSLSVIKSDKCVLTALP